MEHPNSLVIAYSFLFGFIGMALLGACAPIEPADTTAKQIAYAYGALAAVRTETARLLDNKRITIEQAKEVQADADEIRSGLDLAASLLRDKKEPAAQDHLHLALQALTALESFLKTKR
jgi:hypothetical protein